MMLLFWSAVCRGSGRQRKACSCMGLPHSPVLSLWHSSNLPLLWFQLCRCRWGLAVEAALRNILDGWIVDNQADAQLLRVGQQCC